MKKKLPIGIQELSKIIENDCVYIDKTALALQLIEEGDHYFLSRPRRFGKSLFLNTLAHIFKGNKKLFEGLAIHESNYSWKTHPVLYFDFSGLPLSSSEDFHLSLALLFKSIASLHNIELEGPVIHQLRILIQQLSKQENVVVLIDEYDKPILDHLKNPKIAENNRSLMRDFFSILKAMDKYLRFTFVTGISRFSRSSLFSGFNNLKDISFNEKYASICGYTEEDIDKYFDKHLDEYVEKKQVKRQEVKQLVKSWYNGYRFTESPLKVYNPFSTLSFFDEAKVKNYWFNTGTPSFLINQLVKKPIDLLSLSNIKESINSLSSVIDIESMTTASLMFQAGYLTIKDCVSNNYILDFPNREVRESLFESLLIHLSDKKTFTEQDQIKKAFEEENIHTLVKLINEHFAKLSYSLFKQAKEGFFHAIFLSILQLSGIRVFGEMHTNIGRIDLVVEREKTFYVIECKLDKSATKALEQIKEKGYIQPYLNRGKKVIALGINFSSKSRNISEYSKEEF